MAAAVEITELSSPGCQHCAEFERFWKSIEGEFPSVQYKNVSVLTLEGQQLVTKHGILASPGIIVNGELFSMGGVDKEKFLARLKELS